MFENPFPTAVSAVCGRFVPDKGHLYGYVTNQCNLNSELIYRKIKLANNVYGILRGGAKTCIIIPSFYLYAHISLKIDHLLFL